MGTDGTRLYDGAYEKVLSPSVEEKVYVGDYAVLTRPAGGSTRTNYLLKDRLGSVDTVTDANGAIAEQRGYDAFGKPRQGSWADLNPPRLSSISNTPRGFTQHEHLNSVELIHMNGRAFDYNLGRFLSVDPIIQFPTNSQSLNPYSYIMNNPLAGTDPTGFQQKCTNPGGGGTCDYKELGSRITKEAKIVSDGKGGVEFAGAGTVGGNIVLGTGGGSLSVAVVEGGNGAQNSQSSYGVLRTDGYDGNNSSINSSSQPRVNNPSFSPTAPAGVRFTGTASSGGMYPGDVTEAMLSYSRLRGNYLSYAFAWLVDAIGEPLGAIGGLVVQPRNGDGPINLWTGFHMNREEKIRAVGEAGLMAAGSFGQRLSRSAWSGAGDLTNAEFNAIQEVVNEAQRPLEVVGSAARRARGPTSDIDYVVPPASMRYFEGLETRLPGLDPEHGIIPGVGNDAIGPVIRFEPNLPP
jgi:RHS repeat-associated protein